MSEPARESPTGMFLDGYRATFRRPSPATMAKLQEMSVATTWAMVNRFTAGHADDFYMEHVRPHLDTRHRCVGPAVTISYRPFDVKAQQTAAFDFFTFADPMLEQQFRNYHAVLDQAWAAIQPGDVLVGEGHGYKDVGQYGDCLLTCYEAKGAIGLVTDATVRDGRHILMDRKVAVFTGGPSVAGALMHISHEGTSRGLIATDVNTPIMVDGVCVRPGDVIVADADGVMAVPLEIVDRVAELGQAQSRLEELSRKLGSEGNPIFDSYLPLVKHIEAAGLTEWLQVVNKYDGGKYQKWHGQDAERIHGPRPATAATKGVRGRRR